MSQAAEITRKAQSNLAFALIDLPETERRHMAEFYAFCRTVDDIVDEPGMTPEERHAALDRWEQVVNGNASDLNELEGDVARLISELDLDITPMMKLIAGCRADINPVQPKTREELLEYTYCVASCVGLTSARILGATEAAFPYAIAMGHALQMVNIIRDISEDYNRHGRIYLPEEDLKRFQYTIQDIANGIHSPNLQALLQYEAELAGQFFQKAEDLYNHLSLQDRNALIPAQAMALIYGNILAKMQTDGFHIYAKRYRLNTFQKLWYLFRARLGISDRKNKPVA
ncbi:phytoene/squalene synthase family protein [Akkermansia sp. N21169]|uniref:phytoene/squalene synthase family protein n=1 Tax=Akkermansia sp. N21169 TaxID=3040765 RepID=UPI00244EF517|nr:phytoene/squalene synthase family protein [Akkermansia sp. N21169]MDH3069058.1 phytoene/squalene synthase family protein [Akkermansia sp. N21169]